MRHIRRLGFVACAALLCISIGPATFGDGPHKKADSSHKKADSRQKNKNTWRNLGAAGAAVAGYGLLSGNKAATVLGAAGAAYSVNRYEQDRHSQDKGKRARARYYYHGGDYTRNGRKYYRYDGHMYYKDLSTGERHRYN